MPDNNQVPGTGLADILRSLMGSQPSPPQAQPPAQSESQQFNLPGMPAQPKNYPGSTQMPLPNFPPQGMPDSGPGFMDRITDMNNKYYNLARSRRLPDPFANFPNELPSGHMYRQDNPLKLWTEPYEPSFEKKT